MIGKINFCKYPRGTAIAKQYLKATIIVETKIASKFVG